MSFQSREKKRRAAAAKASAPLQVGDEVWVRAVVTSILKADRVGIGVRLASRLGSSYAGSSPKFTRVIDGVVRRVAEVPPEDVKSWSPTGESSA